MKIKKRKRKKSDSLHYNKAPKGGDTDSRDSSTHTSEAIQAKPLEVKVYGDNFDRSFKAFRALVQKEHILSKYKDKQVYEKPSEKRRRRKNEYFRKKFEEQVSKTQEKTT